MRPFCSRSPLSRALYLASLALLAAACTESIPPPATAGAPPPAGASVPPGNAAAFAAAPSEENAAVPISATDPVWGSRRAPVSIVLFGDFQCPFTGKILKTVQALEQKYGPSDLRIVWKELPLAFHVQARPAAEAGEAVLMLGQNDAFWRFWELALTHQDALSPASYETWAANAGVDLASYRRLLDAHAGAAKVDAGRTLAEHLGVTGTPTFVINGVVVQGAQPLDAIIAVVDAELVKARARLVGGVPPDVVYADAAKTNWKPIPPDDGDDEPKDDGTKVWFVPVAGAPVRGNKNALVTIVEFSDFQCPYCKRVEGTLKEVRAKYGDKVRLVWKDEPLPFHPHAMPAAELAREARAEKGEAGFWAAHDALFDAAPNLADDDLTALGKTLGLDAGRLKGALAQDRHAAKIHADQDLADDVNAAGTPHFFINGRRLVGAQPIAKFSAVIDEEIAHARAVLAAGTAPAALYDTLMKTAERPKLADAVRVAPRATAPFKGPANAPVVIEEFADFQCPFCGRADVTLHAVTKAYGPKVKLVWRNLPLPFHPYALGAAEAAAEAQRQKGNAGFWTMHDKLFAHQSDADGAGLDRAALDRYAREMALDITAFDKAIDENRHAAEISADTDAATAAHISGTPAFIIGGYLVAGAQPLDKFTRVIEQVLANGPAGGTR
jgi:protein-disulfide isomerase